jgi:hypothetical protein
MSDSFASKEEIDDWYASVVDGLSKGLPLDMKTPYPASQDTCGHNYVILITVLNRLMKGYYSAIGESSEPNLVDFEALVKKVSV